MSAAYPHVPSLAASETIPFGRNEVIVATSSIGNLDQPVLVSFGPLSMVASPAEAIAFGDALIRMAHHYTAAMAEYTASMGEPTVKS